MKKIDIITQRINDSLKPSYFEIKDESQKHLGHLGVEKGQTETHFAIKVTSDNFTGLSLLARHKIINDLLADLYNQGLHALSIKADEK